MDAVLELESSLGIGDCRVERRFGARTRSDGHKIHTPMVQTTYDVYY